jgi:hypothetical protein
MVTDMYNPNHSGGRDREDRGLRPNGQKHKTLSEKNKLKQKGLGARSSDRASSKHEALSPNPGTAQKSYLLEMLPESWSLGLNANSQKMTTVF